MVVGRQPQRIFTVPDAVTLKFSSLFCFVILGLIHLLSVFVHLWQVQLGAVARFEAFYFSSKIEMNE